MNRRVLMVHPRYVMISASPPSACSFRWDAASGRSIGSFSPA